MTNHPSILAFGYSYLPSEHLTEAFTFNTSSPEGAYAITREAMASVFSSHNTRIINDPTLPPLSIND